MNRVIVLVGIVCVFSLIDAVGVGWTNSPAGIKTKIVGKLGKVFPTISFASDYFSLLSDSVSRGVSCGCGVGGCV